MTNIADLPELSAPFTTLATGKQANANDLPDVGWLDRLAETFAGAQRDARADLAADMGERPDFFDTDPKAVDKMLAFMVEKGVISISRREDSLCRPQRSP